MKSNYLVLMALEVKGLALYKSYVILAENNAEAENKAMENLNNEGFSTMDCVAMNSMTCGKFFTINL